MIPKIIHYCWFGRSPKPKLTKNCIKSWRKYCPDYQIVEWNEQNYDLSTAPLYVRQAYEAKKWAFVTDYVRLQVVYEHGGIYLDTDVELVKAMDELLNEHAFFSFEYGEYIATGLGFGAEKNAPILWELMQDYEGVPFVLPDGSFDLTPCPVRNSRPFIQKGLVMNNSKQRVNGCLILPSEYMCPYDGRAKELTQTENTISIHWYGGSWVPKEQRLSKEEYQRIAQRREKFHAILHTPNRLAMRILGEERYQKIKLRMKR